MTSKPMPQVLAEIVLGLRRCDNNDCLFWVVSRCDYNACPGTGFLTGTPLGGVVGELAALAFAS